MSLATKLVQGYSLKGCYPASKKLLKGLGVVALRRNARAIIEDEIASMNSEEPMSIHTYQSHEDWKAENASYYNERHDYGYVDWLEKRYDNLCYEHDELSNEDNVFLLMWLSEEIDDVVHSMRRESHTYTKEDF